LSNRLLSQVHGAGTGSVQIAIHPNESFPRRGFAGRCELTAGQTAMQMPRHEEPSVFRIEMRKPAVRGHWLDSAISSTKISRSHECERGTQECVRHSL
jgi:hypothetical protein